MICVCIRIRSFPSVKDQNSADNNNNSGYKSTLESQNSIEYLLLDDSRIR